MEHVSDFSNQTIQGDPITSDASRLANNGNDVTARQAERVVSASTGISFVASGSVSHSDLKDSASVTGSACTSTLPGHNTTCSLPKSDSSGSLGKLSKFKEDLNDSSTAPRLGKKRRSVLRILFPKLTWSKLRSTSTPLLGSRIQSTLTQTYDGTGDSQDLLSVPQSSLKPHSGQRAVSLTSRANTRPASAVSTGSLAVAPSLQSRQSLMDYERRLSIAGNNRRRKSTFGDPKSHVHEIEDQEDYPERTMHRANPLQSPGRKGTEETLMEKALLQHQAEKAALLRPSNQKIGGPPSPLYAPVFTSPFDLRSIGEARLGAATVDDLDPLESDESPVARRSQSMHDLGSSQGTTATRSSLFRKKKRSTIWTMNTVTTKGTRSHLRATAPPHSWSRYPSHTRERRCGPAGRRDGIICRDFAHDREVSNVQQTASLNEMIDSPKSWPTLVNAKRRNWIVKSRSMTFGAVFRYYSDLLTSSAARNRRSSTATGGRLEHPELEVLPPVLPTHSTTSQQVEAAIQLSRLAEQDVHKTRGEGLDVLNLCRPDSTPDVNKTLSPHTPPVDCLHDGSQSIEKAAESVSADPEEKNKPILSGSVDGIVESRPTELDRALSARRLSCMYQAYVRLPASLDNTEVERSGATDESVHIPDGYNTAGSSEIDVKTSSIGHLAIPRDNQRLPSGPVTRHFPSVTVIDDRKGHWRSVSLLSVDSGKSVRKSTRDLLEVVRATQTQELEKLLGTSEISMTGEESL
jgi:hypothetical protein